MVVLPEPPLGFRTTMRCMLSFDCRVTRVAGKPTHRRMPPQGERGVSGGTPRRVRTRVGSRPAMEEFFLHLWDEADDMYCACRHVATSVATETLSIAAPLLAAVCGALL